MRENNDPSNQDILNKLNNMSEAQGRTDRTLEQHAQAMESIGIRVLDLEKWQIAFKAAENALANANLAKAATPISPDSAYTTINKDLLKLIGKIVGLVSAALTIIYLLINRM